MIIEYDPLGIVVRWPALDCCLLLDPDHCTLVWRGKLLFTGRAQPRAALGTIPSDEKLTALKIPACIARNWQAEYDEAGARNRHWPSLR
jgi:hypothetical protein